MSGFVVKQLPQSMPSPSPSSASDHLSDCTCFCPAVKLVVGDFYGPEDAEYSPQRLPMEGFQSSDVTSI